MTPATEVEDREALRRTSAAVRDAIDPVDRLAKAEVISGNLDSFGAFADAGAIGFYYSVGSQVPTQALIQRVVEIEDRRAFLPFMLNERLELSEWRPSEPVIQGEYVAFQPRFRRAARLEEVEAIVVPALAFDRRGHRLGSGRGLYDELLSRIPEGCVRIGVAFADQIVEELPEAPDDVSVHFVVTEEGVIDCRTA